MTRRLDILSAGQEDCSGLMYLILKPETEQFINAQVKAGRFASREDLIEAALAAFQDAIAEELDDETVAAINEGLAQADRGEGVDLETFRQRFVKRT